MTLWKSGHDSTYGPALHKLEPRLDLSVVVMAAAASGVLLVWFVPPPLVLPALGLVSFTAAVIVALFAYCSGADRRAAHIPRKTFVQAAGQIIVADVSMSLDNVLAVAGAAGEPPVVMIFGLAMWNGLMDVAASFIARLLQNHRWIAYVGLAVILYVALEMIYRGAHELRPVVKVIAGLQ